jgi:hypothetical protein
MPVNNKLYGVYKLLELGGQKYIVERANRNRQMEATPKNYVQGTAKSRIMDIGGIFEEISVSLPILVGGAAENGLDGRGLLNTYVARALDENSTAIPIITSARVSITQEQASVQANFLSDGRPASQAFVVTNFPVDSIPGSPLDPSIAGPTRVARFYDFRCRIGGIIYYIMEATLEVTVQTDRKYFIAGSEVGWGNTAQYVHPDLESTHNPLKSSEANNPYNFGTQFPFIGVTGIRVQGSGKAAVELSDLSVPVDYDFQDYSTPQHKWEAINVDLTTDGGGDGNHYELTWQQPGEVRTAADQLNDPTAVGFQLQIWNPSSTTSGAWEDILQGSGLNLDYSVVTKSDFQVTTGILTVDFSFINWVK